MKSYLPYLARATAGQLTEGLSVASDTVRFVQTKSLNFPLLKKSHSLILGSRLILRRCMLGNSAREELHAYFSSPDWIHCSHLPYPAGLKAF